MLSNNSPNTVINFGKKTEGESNEDKKMRYFEPYKPEWVLSLFREMWPKGSKRPDGKIWKDLAIRLDERYGGDFEETDRKLFFQNYIGTPKQKAKFGYHRGSYFKNILERIEKNLDLPFVYDIKKLFEFI